MSRPSVRQQALERGTLSRSGRMTPLFHDPGRMRKAKYAVIDVETTHGDPRQGRIIELAVLLHDGVNVTDRWSTLVHPRVPLPAFVTRLTGIHRDQLKDAPTFPQAARMLQGFTRGRTIVAHNARYDMTVLAHEFHRVGMSFDRTALCTEVLSRQLVPDLTHYNLGSLCRHLGITFEARHRALPDAEATAELFSRLMERCGYVARVDQVTAMPLRRTA